MSDFVLNWSLNVLIQFTCLAACGLAIATLLRRSPAARSGVLFSALILALFIPANTAVMLWTEHSILEFTIDPLNDSDNEFTEILSDSERIDASGKSSSNWHESSATPMDCDVDPHTNANEPQGLPLDSHSPAMHHVDSNTDNVSLSADRPIDDLSVAVFATPTDVLRDVNGTKQSTISNAMLYIAAGAAWIWLAGSIMLWLRLAVNWYRLGRLLRDCEPCHNLKLEQILVQIAGELRLPRIPEVVISDGVSGPISAGIFRPRIVLPSQFFDRTSQVHTFFGEGIAAHVAFASRAARSRTSTASALFWGRGPSCRLRH